ncbi:MAG: hypothetical protein DWH91_03010 [Planctomycetota bacterium]|nr:MAG: hypothetical protein DWH91_03010 [Planctomycetota bacterium]
MVVPTKNAEPPVDLSGTLESVTAPNESVSVPAVSAPPSEPVDSGLDWPVDATDVDPPTTIEEIAPLEFHSPLSLPAESMVPEPSAEVAPPSETSAPPSAPIESSQAFNDQGMSLEPDTHSADDSLSLDGLTGVVSDAVAGGVVAAVAPPPGAVAAGNSRTVLIALGGYALVVTALCLYLLTQVAKARSENKLESLPDVRQVLNIPINSQLPAGHTLALGEKQRFGNLLVEPLRVTTGPLEVVHFSERDKTTIMKSQVLKLWVRLTNESKDQAFIPLDRQLVFKRHFRDDVCFANNFVVPASKKASGGPVVFVYDHPETSEWDLSGQDLGKTLGPGESWETYIPTTEDGLEELQGELLWRVHVRKGLSPKGGGVTTLVEVAFHDDQIQNEG